MMLYEAAQILLVRSVKRSWLKAWAKDRQPPRTKRTSSTL